MFLVERQWLVNRKTEVKAKRTGFQLFPDYAHTDHIVQGTTLAGAVADCGDVWSSTTPQDMIAGYVAISRVKRADSLLLVLVFSDLLFRHGPPDGPDLLMKRLRKELSSEDAIKTYW